VLTRNIVTGCLQLLEISCNFINTPGKFNCQLKYDNMPITEPNLVTSLNPRNCHLTVFLYSFIRSVLYITDKKLSYCWETVRRESMPRIAEMDVEMAEMTFKCTSRSSKVAPIES